MREEIWSHRESGRQIRVTLDEKGYVEWFQFIGSTETHHALWFLRIGSGDEAEPALYFTGPPLTDPGSTIEPDPEFAQIIAEILAI